MLYLPTRPIQEVNAQKNGERISQRQSVVSKRLLKKVRQMALNPSPSSALIIRSYRPGEESNLREVFSSSVREVACRDYSPEQIEAWAPSRLDDAISNAWKKQMAALSPFVAETKDGLIAAYADLQPSGLIDHFYVSGRFARRGIGTVLMNFLLKKARSQSIPAVTSNVSLTAEPFFRKFGFEMIKRNRVIIRGIELSNASMCLYFQRPKTPNDG